MTPETFCEQFATFAEAPNGVAKLRELILQLAVQGKLGTQDENDEPAFPLLSLMAAEWERRAQAKPASRQELLEPIDREKYDKPIPNGWEVVPFGNVVEIVRGVTFPASAKAKTQTPGTVACLRTTNVQDEVEWDDILYIPRDIVGREDQWVLPNDILISMANSYALVGKVALVKEPHPETTFGGFIAAIRPLLIDPTFVLYVLRSKDIQQELRGTSSQTTNISNISLAGIRPIAFPLPPLAEQRRIVGKVDQLLGLCDELAARQAARREARSALVGATLDRLVSHRRTKGRTKVSGTVFVFPWASAWSQGDFQVELLGDLLRPVRGAVGRAAGDAAPQGRQFRFGLRLLQLAEPESRARHRPFAEERCRQRVLALPVKEARPRPLFRARTQVGPQRVALDVPAHREKVIVLLDRKRLESPLIEMTGPGGSVVRMPALRVRQSQPTHEPRQVAVCTRPQHQVPVIGHQAIRQHPHVAAFASFLQHRLERRVIFRLAKDLSAGVRPVQGMKHHPAIIRSFGSPHDRHKVAVSPCPVNYLVPDTFSIP